ncbi:hypothetical protein F5887DRAFT_1080437 [Amanita rubescens]|nr:hypothetical protein F5887DRAFT_1080437 [Amanita rubescens]
MFIPFSEFPRILLAMTFAGNIATMCDRTYTVVSGDTCDTIAQKNNVPTWQLFCVNPTINPQCSNLHPGHKLCLGIYGHDCKITHTVVPGDTCTSIAIGADISLDTFYKNNPAIHRPQCDNLAIGEVVCTGPKLYYEHFVCPVA